MAVFDHIASKLGNVSSGVGIAFDTNPTTGNSLIVSWAWNGSEGTPSLASSNGNTYVLEKLEIRTGGNWGIAAFVAHNCHGGAETVTPTLAGAGGDIILSEYAKGTNVLQTDKSASAHQDATTDPNSGNTAVTSVAAELVYGFVGTGSAVPTAGSGFTSRASGGTTFGVNAEDKVVSSTGAQAAAYTAVSSNWMCLCVTLMEALAGGGIVRISIAT